MNTKEQKLEAFSRLLDIMDDLREKCPWDKKQTLDSLRHLTIEETYELTDAIIKNDLTELKKEIGDVLLHIVFYAKITSEMGEYDIADIIHTLCEKLIVRHPHIYGDVKAETEQQVKENWEQIKLKEGNKSVLSGVSKGAPSIVKALRMQDKAAQVGFDWETADQVWDKVYEEIGELRHELAEPNNIKKSEQEFGDLLFALINVARKSGLNPDDALEHTNQKFLKRFMFIEDRAKQLNKSLTDMSLVEMDAIWNEAKGK
ncbi:MAG: nucleoside triphosphate pyrophosphohydrolase [Bacteroidia bacterium]|nr:nucleoside triphosphate pyrophosphohydrolase [Bacteroidia bacterium]MCF8427748.1 nucleoside triphosphate pyrophosphohydrolase [Bacteroidia bacterium]